MNLSSSESESKEVQEDIKEKMPEELKQFFDLIDKLKLENPNVTSFQMKTYIKENMVDEYDRFIDEFQTYFGSIPNDNLIKLDMMIALSSVGIEIFDKKVEYPPDLSTIDEDVLSDLGFENIDLKEQSIQEMTELKKYSINDITERTEELTEIRKVISIIDKFIEFRESQDEHATSLRVE